MNNVAMVSDFGMSRDVYESGEYENTSGVWKSIFNSMIVSGLVTRVGLAVVKRVLNY